MYHILKGVSKSLDIELVNKMEGSAEFLKALKDAIDALEKLADFY